MSGKGTPFCKNSNMFAAGTTGLFPISDSGSNPILLARMGCAATSPNKWAAGGPGGCGQASAGAALGIDPSGNASGL